MLRHEWENWPLRSYRSLNECLMNELIIQPAAVENVEERAKVRAAQINFVRHHWWHWHHCPLQSFLCSFSSGKETTLRNAVWNIGIQWSSCAKNSLFCIFRLLSPSFSKTGTFSGLIIEGPCFTCWGEQQRLVQQEATILRVCEDIKPSENWFKPICFFIKHFSLRSMTNFLCSDGCLWSKTLHCKKIWIYLTWFK